MSTATSRVCDECKGVIPTGAPCIQNVSVLLSLATGTQAYSDLDFCCTAHLASYMQSQPLVQGPVTPYKPLP